jgi:probable HAF family extracellular repeat protein
MPIYAYTTLDDPLGPLGTSAQGINTSGQIAGYYLDSSNSSHGFLYSGGTYTTLDDPLASAAAGGTLQTASTARARSSGITGTRASNTTASSIAAAPAAPSPRYPTILRRAPLASCHTA